MALKVTWTDNFGRVNIDSYYRIEDVRIKYVAVPKEGQPTSGAAIVLRGYPNAEWRTEGKQPFPDQVVVPVENIEQLSFADGTYNTIREALYTICKQHPFFVDATDII